MHLVEPKVYLVAETTFVDSDDITDYLDSVGASEFWPSGKSDGENLVELEGRMCYRSYAVGLNPNVSKIRNDHNEYIKNILKSGHGSVLEHGAVSFIIVCSRICTHELVRHRAGTSFSQESMRFVRLDDVPMWIPSVFEKDEFVEQFNRETVERFEEFARNISERYKLDDPNTPFHLKKEVTSAMRRWAPSGHMTTIGVTANFRALRHMIEMRTAPGAEEEIRIVFGQIGKICKERYPAVFQDFSVEIVDGLPCYKPEFRKV